MNEVQHDRVMQVLAEAMELPAARRGAFLDSTCHGEPELRSEVEDLLECVDPAARAFDEAAEDIARADPEQIGPYTILEPIGEGGMAVVYRARQGHPVRRTVALKLIKLGMDTRQFVARFEAERQALALMDHPNVAQVYDAGSTATGRPYFVMEHVPGKPILEYCDAHTLGLRERLELFTLVCDAVEHAHRRGIIHRDIKDSNVLVAEIDGKPVPKVIDFGVAKAMLQPLTERTLHTEHGQLIGTPEYMSPEQAERGGIDVDTRADVYSLGVLLYELIAGVQPIASDALRGADQEQVRRVIRQSEPARPSTRLSTLASGDATRIAQRRGTALPTLIRSLRTELEWIPLKAMRKDREQRYRSAAELGDDIRNYLDGRPLIAGPESRAYRARKFLRRHRASAAASAAMLLMLIGGVVATSWQAVRARRAEANTRAALGRAEHAMGSMRDVNRFLTHDLLWSVDPAVARGRELSIRDALDSAAKNVGARLKDRPLSEIAVRAALAGAYERIGRGDLAMPQAHAALEIVDRIGAQQEPEACEAMQMMGELLENRDRLAEAEGMYRRALEGRRRALGEDDPATLTSMTYLAKALRRQQKFDAAEPLLADALARCRRTLGTDDWRTCAAMHAMALLLRERGNLDEAEPILREAVEVSGRVQGEDHPETLEYKYNLAVLLRSRGQFAEAERLAREALAHRRRIEGDEAHPTLHSMNQLAAILVDQRKFAEAETLFREEVNARRRVQSGDHPETLAAAMNLAFALNRIGQTDAAETLTRETLDAQRRVLGDGDPQTVASVNNLGGLLFDRRRFADAEPLFRSALQLRIQIYGEAHPETLGTTSNLARTLRELGRIDEAEPLFATLYRRAAIAPLPPRQAALFMSHWGPCLATLGRYAEAEAPLREAMGRLEATQQTTGDHMGRVLRGLAEVCDHTNRPDEAARWRARSSTLEAATRSATRPS